ncbi:MAG TPA: hypothetical protein VGD61_11600 [Pyrinomonadaceae bacterium]
MRIFLAAFFVIATSYVHAKAIKLTLPPRCDESLWDHVYIGDRRRFDKPEDRLHVIDRCKTVTGIIVFAQSEADGTFTFA